MEILNLHFWYILFFTFIITSVWFFCYKISYKKNNKIWEILLFLSCLFFIINIFDFRLNIFESKNTTSQSKIMFILDLSKSMKTQDINIDNIHRSREIVSKNIIKDTLNKYPGNQYSLWAFAWEYIQVLPFTSDKNIFLTFLSWLDNNNISKQGTNFSSIFSSLETSLSKENENATIVILTDAENLSDTKFEKYNYLEELHINTLIVWIWTAKWWLIPIWTDAFWRTLHKIYDWEKVVSQVSHKENKIFSEKNNFKYISFEKNWDFKNYEKILSKNLKQSRFIIDWNSNKSLTFYFTLISFLLFMWFLFFDQKLWKK